MHPYFHDLPKLKEIVEQLPNLFDFGNCSTISFNLEQLPNLFDFDRLRTPKNGKFIRNLNKLYITEKEEQVEISAEDMNETKTETG